MLHLRPLGLLTLVLLVYRFFQRFVVDPDLAVRKIISIGVLFSSLVWLMLLPLIYWLYRKFTVHQTTKFILVHLISAVGMGLMQTVLFVYLHNLVWPGILDPTVELSPIYLLADLRLNFFIYWILLGGFYFQDHLVVKDPDPPVNDGILEIRGVSGQLNIRHEDIAFIKAHGNYTLIIEMRDSGKQIHIVRSTLTDLQKILPFPCFLKVQKSYIINREHLAGYARGKHGEFRFTLDTNDTITGSRSMTEDIKLWLSNSSSRLVE